MKKIFLIIFAALFIFSAFSACSTGAKQNEKTPDKGRFIESNISPPNIQGVPQNMCLAEDGYIALISAVGEGHNALNWHYYLSLDNGQSWEKQNIDWLNEYAYSATAENYIRQMFALDNGNLFISMLEKTQDDFYTFRLYIANISSKKLEEVPFDYFDAKNSNNCYEYISIDEVLPEGIAVLSYSAEFEDFSTGGFGTVVLNLNSGTELYSLKNKNMYNCLYSNGSLYFSTHVPNENAGGRDETVSYSLSLESGTAEQQTIAWPLPSEKESIFAMNDGYIYAQNPNGIIKYAANAAENNPTQGSAQELIMPAQGYSIYSPIYKTTGGSMLSENEFFLLLSSEVGGKVLHYRYDENAQNEKTDTLKIYSLYESETLRTAIVEYEIANPNIEVELIIPEKNSEQENYVFLDETMRQLNLDILSGKGPDVLILDSLPVENLVKQDMLLDITSLAAELDILPQLAELIKADNSAHYFLPARFSLPLLFINNDHNDVNITLDEVIENILSAENTESAIKAPLPYEEMAAIHICKFNSLFDIFIRPNIPSLIEENGNVDREELLNLFKQAKIIAEYYNLLQPKPCVIEKINVISAGKNNGFDMPDTLSAFALRRTQLGFAEIKSTEMLNSLYFVFIAESFGGLWQDENAQVAAAAINMPAITSTAYYPHINAAISAASPKPELATNFLRILYSDTVQANSFNDGLPTSSACLENMLTMSQLSNKHIADSGKLYIDMDMQRLLNSLNTAYFAGYAEIIIENNLLDYFENIISLEEAVNNVQAQLSLYMAEKD